MFDLVSVIAIASAAVGLHHGIAHAHYLEAILKFGFAFFATWWAWMNYSWFASAYDDGSPFFKINTMVIMFGSLVFAAGLPRFFETNDLTLGYLGYVVMRFGMVAFWLLAARGHADCSKTALKYALGITLAQIYWVVVIVTASDLGTIYWVLLGLGLIVELAVPYVAEYHTQTPWHREHIIERYGLLNIIVLGEILLAATLSIGHAADLAHFDVRFLHVGLSAFVAACAMWWIYFIDIDGLGEGNNKQAFIWGYGHVLVFASGAAVGGGFAVLVDIIAGKAEVSLHVGDLAVGIPLAVYFFSVWFIRDTVQREGLRSFVLPLGGLVIAALAIVGGSLELIVGTAALTALVHHITSKVSRTEYAS